MANASWELLRIIAPMNGPHALQKVFEPDNGKCRYSLFISKRPEALALIEVLQESSCYKENFAKLADCGVTVAESSVPKAVESVKNNLAWKDEICYGSLANPDFSIVCLELIEFRREIPFLRDIKLKGNFSLTETAEVEDRYTNAQAN